MTGQTRLALTYIRFRLARLSIFYLNLFITANSIRPCTFLIALNLSCTMARKSMCLLFISAHLYVSLPHLNEHAVIDFGLCSLILQNPGVYVYVLVCVRSLCDKPLAHSSCRNLLDVIHFRFIFPTPYMPSNRCYPYQLI